MIDDAIVVRENIVRHVQMGASAHDAALAGTQEIGLAVMATTFSIVAVFLPIGFMGGIVGKFFHEFGLTIVAAVLISMFVSFTLDPMLSSIWHDPQAHGVHHGPPVTRYDRTIGRVTAVFDRFTQWLGDAYQGILGWSLRHKLATLGIALATFVGSFFIIPVLGAEFVPKADFSETQLNFYTPVGSSLELTETRAKQIDAVLRELPEVRYTVTTINSGQAAGKIYGATYVRLADRHERQRSVNELIVPLRERLARIPGITVTNIGVTDLGGGKSLQFSIQGTDLGELERLSKTIMAKLARDSRPGRPRQHAEARQADGRDRSAPRRRGRRRPQRQHARELPAHAGRRHAGRQLARARRRELRRQRAPDAGQPQRRSPTCSGCRSTSPPRPTARRASCGCRRSPTCARRPARTRSTGAT